MNLLNTIITSRLLRGTDGLALVEMACNANHQLPLDMIPYWLTFKLAGYYRDL
jgi:hypothetical protein